MTGRPENVFLNEDRTAVVILDQTGLPGRTEYLTLRTPEEMHDAILRLKVRGAPAIGICAGYCMDCLAQQIRAQTWEAFTEEFHRLKEYLNSSRPTAVNLSWALNRMERVMQETVSSLEAEGRSVPEGRETLLARLEAEAVSIQEEDIRMCRAIAENGLKLLKPGDGLLTHCNAGPLATSLYGTALGPMLLGQERGYGFHVFADETRPLLQGARLTSYELEKAGVDVTLICDNMASMVMKNGWVQACLVGCDRVAANGDTANKIGTSGVAILAKYYGIPLYVLGPTSTIDLNCRTGADIPVEERRPEEIREMFYREPMAPSGVKCYNPAFDVTDHELIAGIVTEYGVCRPPYTESLKETMQRAAADGSLSFDKGKNE